MGVLFLMIRAEWIVKTDLFLNLLDLLGGGVLLASSDSGEGTATTSLYSLALFMPLVALAGFTLISRETFGGPAQVMNLITFYPESAKFLGGSALVLIVSRMMNISSNQLVRD